MFLEGIERDQCHKLGLQSFFMMLVIDAPILFSVTVILFKRIKLDL